MLLRLHQRLPTGRRDPHEETRSGWRRDASHSGSPHRPAGPCLQHPGDPLRSHAMQRVVYRPWFEWRDLRPASLLLHLCLRPDYGPLTGTEPRRAVRGARRRRRSWPRAGREARATPHAHERRRSDSGDGPQTPEAVHGPGRNSVDPGDGLETPETVGRPGKSSGDPVDRP